MNERSTSSLTFIFSKMEPAFTSYRPPTLLDKISSVDEVYSWVAERFQENSWKVDECIVDDGQTLKLYSENLGDNGIESLVRAFSTNSTITCIDLGDNNIGNEGIKHLARVLSKNSTVTTINLDINNIGDEGAKYIIDSLQTNTTVTTIQLNDNDISTRMLSTIDDLLKRNISFKSTQSENNHETRDDTSNIKLQEMQEQCNITNNTHLRQSDKKCDASLHMEDVIEDDFIEIIVKKGTNEMRRLSKEQSVIHDVFVGSSSIPDTNQQDDIVEDVTLDVSTHNEDTDTNKQPIVKYNFIDSKAIPDMKHKDDIVEKVTSDAPTRNEDEVANKQPIVKHYFLGSKSIPNVNQQDDIQIGVSLDTSTHNEDAYTRKHQIVEHDFIGNKPIIDMDQKDDIEEGVSLDASTDEECLETSKAIIIEHDVPMPPIICEGTLQRRKYKRSKREYFVLRENGLLSSYKGKNYIVENIRNATESCNLKIKFSHKKSESTFKVSSNEDKDKWVSAGIYIKLLKQSGCSLNAK